MVLLVAFLLSLFLYKDSLDYYFFQDDFFEINISGADSLKDYLSFFKFRDDIIAYRPISLQNYFFINQNLFDLNPAGFRLITLILFFQSGFLIYKVSGHIFKSTKTGLIASFLWLTSSIHFMTITWIAAAYNIIGTFFWLLTSFTFLKFIETRKLLFFVLTLFAFLLTITSYEFSVTWPAIWGLYFFYILKNPLTKSLKIFLPFIIASAIYILARFVFIKVPQIPEYDIALNTESIKSFFWYLLWAFNIPEELKKQVTGNLISFNPIFLAEFWKITVISFTALLWIITLGIAMPIFVTLKQKVSLHFKLTWFSLAFFSLAISPVLILPNHTFSMYLTLAAIGLYMLIAYLLTQLNSKAIVFFALVIWVFSSYSAIAFYRINSWMVEAQKVSREFSQQAKEQFPSLPAGSTLLYDLPYPWQWQALSYQEGIGTVYNDRTLSIYYNEQSLRKDFKEGKVTGPVFIYEK